MLFNCMKECFVDLEENKMKKDEKFKVKLVLLIRDMMIIMIIMMVKVMMMMMMLIDVSV